MTDFRIWTTIIALSVLTFMLRGSFIAFWGKRQLPEYIHRYLRYVAVAIIPGMIAGLVVFPASLDGSTNPSWLLATLAAVLAGLKWKNPLIIMLIGAAVYLILTALI